MLFHNKNKDYKERRIPLVPIPGRITSLAYYIKYIYERAALCTSASLTAETAVIVPLFLMAMLSLISVMNVCQIQIKTQQELSEKAKRMSMYTYLADDYPGSEYIDLIKVENCKLAVSLLPGYEVKMALRGRVHSWTGRSTSECSKDKDEVFCEMVYVTEYQSVYHTNAECTHLDLSMREVKKEELPFERNESGARYHACEKCGSDDTAASVYYISETGDRYHVSETCSGLIRNIRLIRKSEAGNIPCCSRCQESG